LSKIICYLSFLQLKGVKSSGVKGREAFACTSEYFPHFIFFNFLKLSMSKTQSELPSVITKNVIEDSISILAVYTDKKRPSCQ